MLSLRRRGLVIGSSVMALFAIVALALAAAAISNGGTVSCTYYDSANQGAPAKTISEHIGISSGAGVYGCIAAVLALLVAAFVFAIGLHYWFGIMKVLWAVPMQVCVALVVSLSVVIVLLFASCVVLGKSSSDAESNLEAQTFNNLAVTATCASRSLSGYDLCNCAVGGTAIASSAFALLTCIAAVVCLVLSSIELHLTRTAQPLGASA